MYLNNNQYLYILSIQFMVVAVSSMVMYLVLIPLSIPDGIASLILLSCVISIATSIKAKSFFQLTQD